MRIIPKKENTSRRTGKKTQTRVGNYYTPASNLEIDLDLSRKVKKRSKTGLKYKPVIRNIIIAIFIGFVGFNVLILKPDVVIIADNDNFGRLSTYKLKLNEKLESSILSQTKLSIRSSSAESYMLNEFPEIKSININVSIFGRRPVAYIETWPPIMTISTLGESMVIAENGRVSGTASDFSGLDRLTNLIDESGIKIQKGDSVMRSDDAKFIGSIQKIFTLKGRGVDYVRITATPREIYVKPTDKPYELRFFLDDPVETQLGSFFAVEQTLGEGGIAPNKYVDLRAGEKIFWQ